MSSIAYVTDKHMIEFHRLNGNDGINFWRPSLGKRFTDFNSGDLLFFLAKGTERLHSKEKGLIGYGRFSQSESLSYRQMWNRYHTLNGYPSELSLKEAILRVAKSKTLPTHLSCLHLKDVVFFQSPVYLSELGLQISNNVESFIYLDKDDPEMTTKILLKANELGVDAWTSAVSPTNPTATVFDDDLNWHILQSQMARLPLQLSETEQNKVRRILKKYHEDHPETRWLDASHQALFRYTHQGIVLIQCLFGPKSELLQRAVYRKGVETILLHCSSKFVSFEGKDLIFINLMTQDQAVELGEKIPIHIELLSE